MTCLIAYCRLAVYESSVANHEHHRMVPLEFGFYQIESMVCLSPAVCKAGNAVATPPPQAGRMTVVDISQIISRKNGRSTIISFPHT